MSNFYAYNLTIDDESKNELETKFSEGDLYKNVLELEIDKNQKRKYALIIENRTGNFICGYFGLVRDDTGLASYNLINKILHFLKPKPDEIFLEYSHFIFNMQSNKILGEFKASGVRYFTNWFDGYLKKYFNKGNINLEVLPIELQRSDIISRDCKSARIKVTKPQLDYLEEVCELDIKETINEAFKNDDFGFNIDIIITAGTGKDVKKGFVKKMYEKIMRIENKKGIKNAAIMPSDSDTWLELIKEKHLKLTIDIKDKTHREIFNELISNYNSIISLS